MSGNVNPHLAVGLQHMRVGPEGGIERIEAEGRRTEAMLCTRGLCGLWRASCPSCMEGEGRG